MGTAPTVEVVGTRLPRTRTIRSACLLRWRCGTAMYHATGTRFRSLPISIEKVLGAASSRRALVRPEPEARCDEKRFRP